MGCLAPRHTHNPWTPAMVNEVLCKLLAYKLRCPIQEQETLGIVPVFWKDEGEPAVCRPDVLPMVRPGQVASPKEGRSCLLTTQKRLPKSRRAPTVDGCARPTGGN